MIIGIGTDIVEILRIEKLIQEFGVDVFAKKILSASELKQFHAAIKPRNYAAHLAKRFAAKEAISKALGTGIGKTGFKDITITNNKNGAPQAKIKGFKGKIHLSLADEKTHAIAFAVLES